MERKAGIKGVLRHSDAWVGLSIFLVGAAAAFLASGFNPMSRSYPLLLCVLLMLFGAGLILRVILSEPISVSFALPGRVAALTALIIVLWIGALALGFGFVLPTLLMQIFFLVICGVRSPVRVALYATLITVAGYVAFVLGLGVRMPETLFPYLI